MIYNVLVYNTNALTKHSELDVTGDETTWEFMGYGDPGSGIMSHVIGKPGVSKGGQTVIISDPHRIRPCAYVHRHKFHGKIKGLTAGGTEVQTILKKVLPMVEGAEEGNVKKIFRLHPHSTWDNYFCGDNIMNWIGQNGFGTTMTIRRDCLPKAILGKYLHKKKTGSGPREKKWLASFIPLLQ